MDSETCSRKSRVVNCGQMDLLERLSFCLLPRDTVVYRRIYLLRRSFLFFLSFGNLEL